MHVPARSINADNITAFHRASPMFKLLAAVSLLIVIVSLPLRLWPVHVVIAGGLLGVCALARVRRGAFLRRFAMLEPMVLAVAVLSLFQPGGAAVFATMAARSTLCLLTALTFAAITPFADLVDALRQLRVPALLITTIALMHRYLFVLLDESQRMRRARQARTFTTSRRRQWSNLASVAAQLFLRASDRADRIYAAMCARGWR